MGLEEIGSTGYLTISEEDPSDVFREILLYGKTEGGLLTIRTKLEFLETEFVESYSKLFPWHVKDSFRSLLTGTISNPTYEFSYHNRIHNYFETDQLKHALSTLQYKKSSRPIVTWDPRRDLRSEELIPCLMILQFSIVADLLDLTVIFRSRDIIRRMIPNWNALKILQQQTADQLRLQMGALNDISLKWFYKKEDYEKVKEIL